MSDLRQQLQALAESWRSRAAAINAKSPKWGAEQLSKCSDELDALVRAAQPEYPDRLMELAGIAAKRIHEGNNGPTVVNSWTLTTDVAAVWSPKFLCPRCGTLRIAEWCPPPCNTVSQRYADLHPWTGEHRGDFATCPHPDCALVRAASPPVPEDAIDHGRVVAQAIDISKLLTDAGIPACPLPEGVRLLIKQRDVAAGVRDTAPPPPTLRASENAGADLKGTAGKPPTVAEQGSSDTGPANVSPLLATSDVPVRANPAAAPPQEPPHQNTTYERWLKVVAFHRDMAARFAEDCDALKHRVRELEAELAVARGDAARVPPSQELNDFADRLNRAIDPDKGVDIEAIDRVIAELQRAARVPPATPPQGNS